MDGTQTGHRAPGEIFERFILSEAALPGQTASGDADDSATATAGESTPSGAERRGGRSYGPRGLHPLQVRNGGTESLPRGAVFSAPLADSEPRSLHLCVYLNPTS